MVVYLKVNFLLFIAAIVLSSVAGKDIRGTSQESSDILPDGYIGVRGGGAPAAVGQFPWMVRMDIYVPDEGLALCGGSLISDRHVLSATHCFEGVKSYSAVVVCLGEYDSKTYPRDCADGNCTENIKLHPDKIYEHPDFNNETYANDIAVLRLEKRVQLSNTIQPIALPTFDPEDKIVGFLAPDPVVGAGWGRDENMKISNVLLSTDIFLINRTVCSQYYYVPEGHFCAGNQNKSTCPGDSGGPLMMFQENKYVLVGIISYLDSNDTCPALVGFYTNVYKYMDFIATALTNSE